VINITTRNSAETPGGLVAVSVGTQQRRAALRYGGRISESVTYRAYASAFQDDDTRTAAGSANDHWSKPQVGFRIDWTASDADLVTVQGDAYRGDEAQRGAPAQSVRGGNLTARWGRSWSDGSALQVQAYYDRAARGAGVDGSGLQVDTYDLDVQHSLAVGPRHQLVWGGGYRLSRYRIDGTPQLFFRPATGDLKLFNAFVQDSVALTPALTLVLGAKLEDDPYVRPVLLPTARLAWTPAPGLTAWTAVSRAIRSPTPFDRDVVEVLGGQTFLVGGPDFRSERLTAYETGVKLQGSGRASLSVSAFYNDYDELRNIELAPQGFLPLRWGNGLRGHTYGVEAWGAYQAADWWRLTASMAWLDEKFRFRSGAGRILGVEQIANDPKYHATLGSSMTFGQSVTLDAEARYVSAFPEPRVPAYVELNARLGWALNERLEFAVSGRNLLHARHREYTDGTQIPRSVSADLQWRF
jgi:iron complex outermembrane receptor protein